MKVFHTGRKGARKTIFHILICFKISQKMTKEKYQKSRRYENFSLKIFRVFFVGVQTAAIKSDSRFHCFPHTFRDTFFSRDMKRIHCVIFYCYWCLQTFIQINSRDSFQ